MVLLYNNKIMHLCPLSYFIRNSFGRWYKYTTTVLLWVRLMLTVILKKLKANHNQVCSIILMNFYFITKLKYEYRYQHYKKKSFRNVMTRKLIYMILLLVIKIHPLKH